MNKVLIPASTQGLQLSTAVCAPDSPKAVLVIAHGMIEHKERYYPFMEYLAGKGIASVCPDLRGHGESAQSEEELGFFGKNGKEAIVNDVCGVLEWAGATFPGKKVFLLGHSMGALVVTCLIKKHDHLPDGVIVSGIPAKVAVAGLGGVLTRMIGLFKGKHYRSAFLANIALGAYEKPFAKEGVKNAWLSTNRENVDAYNKDPLCGFVFTANGYTALMKLLVDCYSDKGWEVKNPSLPIHFASGSQDPCTGGAKKFSKAVGHVRGRGYGRVSAKLYPGMRHEILNETGKEDVWNDIDVVLESWMQ